MSIQLDKISKVNEWVKNKIKQYHSPKSVPQVTDEQLGVEKKEDEEADINVDIEDCKLLISLSISVESKTNTKEILVSEMRSLHNQVAVNTGAVRVTGTSYVAIAAFKLAEVSAHVLANSVKNTHINKGLTLNFESKLPSHTYIKTISPIELLLCGINERNQISGLLDKKRRIDDKKPEHKLIKKIGMILLKKEELKLNFDINELKGNFENKMLQSCFRSLFNDLISEQPVADVNSSASRLLTVKLNKISKCEEMLTVIQAKKLHRFYHMAKKILAAKKAEELNQIQTELYVDRIINQKQNPIVDAVLLFSNKIKSSGTETTLISYTKTRMELKYLLEAKATDLDVSLDNYELEQEEISKECRRNKKEAVPLSH